MVEGKEVAWQADPEGRDNLTGSLIDSLYGYSTVYL